MLLRYATIVLALALAGPARSEDAIIMVGESTTWGLRSDNSQSPLNAAATLESLLAQDPGCAFGGLRVENWAVSATNTKEWFLERPDAFCAPRGRHPLVDYACDNDLPLALAVEPLAAQRGLTIRLVLVNAQGTNDAHSAISRRFERRRTSTAGRASSRLRCS